MTSTLARPDDEGTSAPPADFATFYDATLRLPTPYSSNGFYFAKARDRMDRSFALIKDSVAGKAILDIGASPFYLLYRCIEAGACECHGTYFTSDSHPLRDRSEIHSPFGPIRIYHANIETEPLPVPDDSMDIVTACEILEHVDYLPTHLASEVRRVLRPDGLICITVPNVAAIANILKLIGQRNIYMRYRSDASGRHKHEYTIAQLRSLVEWMGFEVVKSGVMPSPTSDKWWLRPIYRALAITPMLWRYSPVLYIIGRASGKLRPVGKPPAIIYDDAQSIEA